jgi:hypothetical protein
MHNVDAGSKVDHRIHAAHGIRNGVGICDIAMGNVNVRECVMLERTYEPTHAVAVRYELFTQAPADKSGCPGN